jgi:hypothetical protein
MSTNANNNNNNNTNIPSDDAVPDIGVLTIDDSSPPAAAPSPPTYGPDAEYGVVAMMTRPSREGCDLIRRGIASNLGPGITDDEVSMIKNELGIPSDILISVVTNRMTGHRFLVVRVPEDNMAARRASGIYRHRRIEIDVDDQSDAWASIPCG